MSLLARMTERELERVEAENARLKEKVAELLATLCGLLEQNQAEKDLWLEKAMVIVKKHKER